MADNLKYDLRQRTLDFSVVVIKYGQTINQPIMRSIIDQLVRSTTSIGANYAEANNASSKTDFRNKIYIAKKECAETEYWLDILLQFDGKNDSLITMRKEAHELTMIFQKIVNSLRSN